MDDYLKVLAHIKSYPKTFQSNYVRNNAELVAEAASRQHITSLGVNGRSKGVWEITTEGMVFLKTYGGTL